MDTNEILLLLLLCELVSAVFVMKLWCARERMSRRTLYGFCLLFMLPILGWLIGWYFAGKLISNAKDGAASEGIAGKRGIFALSGILPTLAGFCLAMLLFRKWASEDHLGMGRHCLLVALVAVPALWSLVPCLFHRASREASARRPSLLDVMFAGCLPILCIMVLCVVVAYSLGNLVWRFLKQTGWAGGLVLAGLLTALIVYSWRQMSRARPPEAGVVESLDEARVAAEEDRLGLLWLIRQEADDAMIDEMVRWGDGGECEGKALVEVLRTGVVPRPLAPDDLGEVCAISRCSEAQAGTTLSPTARREALMRCLAGWILVSAGTRPDEADIHVDNVPANLHALAASSLALGPEFVRAAARFIGWAEAAWSRNANQLDQACFRLSRLILCSDSLVPEGVAMVPELCETLPGIIGNLPSEYCEPDRTGRDALPAETGKPLFVSIWDQLTGQFEPPDLREWRGLAAMGVRCLDQLRASSGAELDPRVAALRAVLVRVCGERSGSH